MEWWSIWLLAGVVCMGLELLIPGLVIIFFSFGAILTSFCSIIPIINNTVWLQIIIFILFSLFSLLFLRKRFKPIFIGTVFYPSKNEDIPCENIAEVQESIFLNKKGRIKYKGTTWTARSNDQEIKTGEIVRILRREGLTYIVEKIKS